MDNHHPSPVNVTVSGTDGATVRGVTSVIAGALQQAGFTDVACGSLNSEPEEPMQGSLLDSIRAARPHLFQTPISVSYLYNEERQPLDIEGGTAHARLFEAAGPGVEVRALEITSELSPAQEEEQEMDVQALMAGAPLDAQADNPPLDSPADQQLAQDMERERTEA